MGLPSHGVEKVHSVMRSIIGTSTPRLGECTLGIFVILETYEVQLLEWRHYVMRFYHYHFVKNRWFPIWSPRRIMSVFFMNRYTRYIKSPRQGGRVNFERYYHLLRFTYLVVYTLPVTGQKYVS